MTDMRVEITPEELLDLMRGLLGGNWPSAFLPDGCVGTTDGAAGHAVDGKRDGTAASGPERAVDGDLPVCNKLVRAVTVWLSQLEKWAATRSDATPPEVLSFARVEQGCLHVHVSMPSFQPDGLTLYDNMLDLPDGAGWKDTFNLIADGITNCIGITFGDDMRDSFSDYVNGHPSDGQA